MVKQISSFATVVGLTLLAGCIAGILVACFHFVATEPVLQAVFTHPEQRVGLFLGYIMYGIGWSSLFGMIYWFTMRRARLSEPGNVSWKWLFTLLCICYWTFCLFPQLMYPASQLGIGDGILIDMQQRLYLRVVLLSILGTVFALVMYRFFAFMEKEGLFSRWTRLLGTFVLYGSYASMFWLLVSPYPINFLHPLDLPRHTTAHLSMHIILRSRWLSGTEGVLFWCLLGMIFLLL